MDTSEPGYAQAAPRRVRALGPSRANPRAPRRRRVQVSLENEASESGPGDSGCSDGGSESGWGPGRARAHRLHVSPSLHPSGRPWASKRTPGKHIISKIIFCPLIFFIFYVRRGCKIPYLRYGRYVPLLCYWLCPALSPTFMPTSRRVRGQSLGKTGALNFLIFDDVWPCGVQGMNY